MRTISTYIQNYEDVQKKRGTWYELMRRRPTNRDIIEVCPVLIAVYARRWPTDLRLEVKSSNGQKNWK